MSPVPVYSQQLEVGKNTSGSVDLLNATGALLLIRTVTVYYGGDPASFWSLELRVDRVIVMNFQAPGVTGAVPFSRIETELHICWLPDQELHVVTDQGWDWSLHGYQLSLP